MRGPGLRSGASHFIAGKKKFAPPKQQLIGRPENPWYIEIDKDLSICAAKLPRKGMLWV